MKATSDESSSVVRWPPASSPGGAIGLAAVIFSTFFAVLAAISLAGGSLPRLIAIALLIFFLVLAVIFAYLFYGYVTMGYELTVDHLSIRWAQKRHVIPIGAVQQILPAVERLDPNPRGWQRFWPGYYVGEQATLSGLVTIVATLNARRQLLLVTRDYQFAISPERPVLFVETFAQLRGAASHDSPERMADWQPATLAARFVEAGWSAPDSAARPRVEHLERAAGDRSSGAPFAPGRPAIVPRLWSDAVSSGLLIAALLLDIGMTLFVLARYDSFPQVLPIHWNANGVADRFGSTRQIWTIPLITWLVTIANVAVAWFVDRFDRFAARFLLAASLAVSSMALIALYWMIHSAS